MHNFESIKKSYATKVIEVLYNIYESSILLRILNGLERGGDYMTQTMAVAKYFNDLHMEKHGCAMDQMKMHKMMYFSQRESLMISGNPLFSDDFEAWKYGPVLLSVRNEYLTGHMFAGEYDELDDTERNLVASVYERYDEYDAWQLSTLSHAEHSWRQARKDLGACEAGHEKMSLSAMKVDATREFLRRKGVVLS